MRKIKNKLFRVMIFMSLILAFFACIDDAKASYMENDNENDFSKIEFPSYHNNINVGTTFIRNRIKSLISEDIKTIEDTNVSCSNEQDEEIDYIIHVVTPTDTLWNLAKKYYGDGMMFPYIMEANGLWSTMIIDDTQLYIPVEYIETSAEFSYDVEGGNVEKEETYSSNLEFIGAFKITGYDPWCAHCCTTTNGITASGVEAVVGRTVACNSIPMGTQIYIEGYGYYTVEDTGGMGNNVIDIACNNHSECYDITNKSGVNVYIVE